MNSVVASYLGRETVGLPLLHGEVRDVQGLILSGTAPRAAVGDLYGVQLNSGTEVTAEVVGLRDGLALLMPFGEMEGVAAGARLRRLGRADRVSVGGALLGRVVDAFGRPLDGRAAPVTEAHRPLRSAAMRPHERKPVRASLSLGIRSLDAFVPFGEGQRIAIMASAGVGKSTLVGTVAQASAADVVVLALVGERGREVAHFVHEVLGEEGLKRAVVVVSTSDRPAPERVRVAFVATAMAEYFRAQGKSVLLMMDSLTRLCMAQREIGLATGEPPVSRGYPPSAFALLPPLLERAGAAHTGGSISAIYTVLVEGEAEDDPVAEYVRGILDGHIVLSRSLAARGHYPAVDVLRSLSRLETGLSTASTLDATRRVREWLGKLEDAQDLLAVGAYVKGGDAVLDEAIERREAISNFLCQRTTEPVSMAETLAQLHRLAEVAA